MTENINPKTREQLSQECAPISYKEIEQFFARGMMVLVDNSIDILDVALLVQADDSQQLEKIIKQGKITRVHDEYAKTWSQENPQLMAITVVPWLLVQEKVLNN